MTQKLGCFHNSPIHKKNFKFKNSSITPSYQHVLAQRHPRSNMKYLTGLAQNPAVTISTYFTVKKFASLAIISQNPGFIEIQVLELFYSTSSAIDTDLHSTHPDTTASDKKICRGRSPLFSPLSTTTTPAGNLKFFRKKLHHPIQDSNVASQELRSSTILRIELCRCWRS